MIIRTVFALMLLLLSIPTRAQTAEIEAEARLMNLPHADITRLIGSWEVEEMKPLRMIYEFQTETMAMHGKGQTGGSTFELTLDADYRQAATDAVWVIGTHPRPVPEGGEEQANNPSIMGIEFTSADHAKLTVSAEESFTLVRVP